MVTVADRLIWAPLKKTVTPSILDFTFFSAAKETTKLMDRIMDVINFFIALNFYVLIFDAVQANIP